MLHSTPLQEQYAQATGDALKILIVGAGIAGVTAAQLLRKNGRHPVLIERHQEDGHPGYMLALMPMVQAALKELEIEEAYRKRSIPFHRYGLHGHKGRMIRIDSMDRLLKQYGDYRGIARGKLLEALTLSGCNLTFDTTVSAMESTAAHTVVRFKTGTTTTQLNFDLVIIADGLHSHTRKMVLGNQPVQTLDTHWGGWVIWTPEDDNMDLGEELWGAGCFYGIYPVKGALGAFLGGDVKDTGTDPAAFVKKVRTKVTAMNPRMEQSLQAIATDEAPFFWELSDCRSPQWAFPNSVLLGDAAAGFLPTAGIGAGMAMESAWVLTRILKYANKENLSVLLKAYENAQRPRVESAQDNSRELAKIMFRKSRLLAWFRDLISRLISVETALKPIRTLLDTPPDPDQTARAALAAIGRRPNEESNKV